MTKKKSFLSFLLAFILILPCMFFMTACGDTSGGPGGSGSGTGGSGGSGGGTGIGGGSGSVTTMEQILENLGDNWAITVKYSDSNATAIENWDGEIQVVNGGTAMLYKDKTETDDRFDNVLEKDGLVYSDQNEDLTEYTTCEAKMPGIDAFSNDGYGYWASVLSISLTRPDAGYTTSSITFLGRPCTQYQRTLTPGPSVSLSYLYIVDNATGLIVKYVQTYVNGETEVEGFQVTEWLVGNQDISADIAKITRGNWYSDNDLTNANLTTVAAPQNAQFLSYRSDIGNNQLVYVYNVEEEAAGIAICQAFYNAGANMSNEIVQANFEDLFTPDYGGNLFKAYTSSSNFITVLVGDDYGEGRAIEIRLPLPLAE